MCTRGHRSSVPSATGPSVVATLATLIALTGCSSGTAATTVRAHRSDCRGNRVRTQPFPWLPRFVQQPGVLRLFQGLAGGAAQLQEGTDHGAGGSAQVAVADPAIRRRPAPSSGSRPSIRRGAFTAANAGVGRRKWDCGSVDIVPSAGVPACACREWSSATNLVDQSTLMALPTRRRLRFLGGRRANIGIAYPMTTLRLARMVTRGDRHTDGANV
jgi:hypothetical protein